MIKFTYKNHTLLNQGKSSASSTTPSHVRDVLARPSSARSPSILGGECWLLYLLLAEPPSQRFRELANCSVSDDAAHV